MKLSFFLFFISLVVVAQKPATVFSPIEERKKIEAGEIKNNLKIDGKLDEGEWKNQKATNNFIQVEPNQGEKANFDSWVKMLYNRRFLYIGVFNKDTLGRKGLRVPNFKRDFDPLSQDLFGVSIDGFNDKRNAMSLITNPYGTQKDLLSYDDALYDTEWDGLWKVRTSRTDSGWVAEYSIPWQTLRYAKSKDSLQSWGINFFRNRRYSNEVSGWNPYPRAFSAYRMDYAGILMGIKPPPPSPNIRILPYVLFADNNTAGKEIGYNSENSLKIGGDLKWAINPNAILDITANTDFAQADVDRQVNNVSRFEVFFPERRQFFLENASLFGVGIAPVDETIGGQMVIQPFFSRKIGLDDFGKPIPIDVGGRFVYRSLKRNFGGILMRQRSYKDNPLTYYAVARFSENIGEQNRIGGLITVKNQNTLNDTVQGYTNTTGSFDGFFRINESLSFNFMATGSSSGKYKGNGFSGYAQFMHKNNQWIGWWTESVVSKDFSPEVGFVSRQDVLATTPGMFLVNRAKWLPTWIRNFEPGVFIEVFHKLSTGNLQEYQLNANPFWFTFQNGGLFGLFYNPIFERLDDGDFRPLDLNIKSGKYHFTRFELLASTDQSKKIYISGDLQTGKYYDGKLTYLHSSFRYSPIPYFSLGMNYEINKFKNVGEDLFTNDIQLWSVENRTALNPRLQLISFYQKNTFNNRDVWNIRLAWEFKPLSFIYLVYNQNFYDYQYGTQSFNKNNITIDRSQINMLTQRQQQSNFIAKISFLKQF